MALVALLSNPRSTGNQSMLPRVRRFCARHEEIFHYEVEHVDQISAALRSIARVKPRVLVVNGGDGTVQAALTELYHGGHFETPPPVAVLANGKTNLIAHDLGADGDPIAALERVLELARSDLEPHIVSRELISLTDGDPARRPVLGMFLGGAGLADTMLYCRHKIYPLGLPNAVAHALALLLGLIAILVGRPARFLPMPPRPITVSVTRSGVLQGSFAFLMVTTLQRLLFSSHMPGAGQSVGSMQLLVIERNLPALIRALVASIRGRLGRISLDGVHIERGEEIRIEGSGSSVLLDGELFEAGHGRPIVLRPTAPVPFLRLAA
ncbi:diacylglycerol kinase family protein [Sphingosinicella sp. CPCC 101087]|uniref:diacylglycerol/lipid kinase family protein n=1 Tax=Sphingosinicella sp. CPCC 101087 TaxID=2497754 RepID=UPI00101BAF01|nr:acylglycerol kinase family protein [Sphingosinicella sp. CPCC 101087]